MNAQITYISIINCLLLCCKLQFNIRKSNQLWIRFRCLLNTFTFCTVRIVQEGEEAFAGPDSLVVVVGLVGARGQALEEEACYRMEVPALALAGEAYYQMEDLALAEVVHDLMEED